MVPNHPVLGPFPKSSPPKSRPPHPPKPWLLDADLAEREMVSHLFDVVRRIESNLKIDLDLETMFGVDLIQQED